MKIEFTRPAGRSRTVHRPVTEAVEEVFGFAETNVVPLEDLCGQAVAALTRATFDAGLLTEA